MEQRVWREIEENLNATLAAGDSPSLQSLSSVHSLILNPSTSDLTFSSILKTLNSFLSCRRLNHHIFALLAATSLRRPDLPLYLSTSIVPLSSSLLSDPNSSPRLAAAAISLLLSTAAIDGLDDTLLVSLCFRPCVSVRVWFLKNALRFPIRPNLLLTVLLGFTKDPYPCVRQAALDGLVGVCGSGVEVDDSGIVEGCYFRSVELLRDHEDYVRQAAVRVIICWGLMLAASKQEGDKTDWFDAVFLQVCAMVRDMNVGVRVEAFTALGKLGFVSEDILLQSLSKKILGTIKEKPALSPRGVELYEIHGSNAAGAFIHGLEDEYSKVQRAACISMRMLSALSDRFAGEAVDLLMYVLNDDSMIVRLEALETLNSIVKPGSLKMQEEHLDMLLGTLVDKISQIRFKALNILGSVKLPGVHVFKLTVESLLRSLDLYPESETEIFRTLINMGQNQGNYAVNIVEEFYHEINSSGDGKFDFNGPKVAGLLVLAISASFKHEKYSHRIPSRVFSFSAAFFGRISHVFSDVLDEDSLLAHLSNCGNWGVVESKTGPRLKALPVAKGQQEAAAHLLDSVKLISATMINLWPLVKSGCKNEALKALRCYKESLATVRSDSLENTGAVAFVFQYICIVKLLAKIWEHFVDCSQCHVHQMADMGFLLNKLDKALLALRYRFIGLSEEDELYILELLLLSYVLRFSSFHRSCATLQKIYATITCVDILRNTKSIACSEFLNELAELPTKGNFSQDGTSCNYFKLRKLLDAFVLRGFSLTQTIRHISAEVGFPGFNFVSPLRFVSGLPVGVPLEITLYNVTDEHRVWIRMTLEEELTEFVFLDMEQFGGHKEVKNFKFTSSFYRTPKVNAFTLRINIGIECVMEDLHLVKGHGGPKHSLIYLCPEKEVYFVKVNR